MGGSNEQPLSKLLTGGTAPGTSPGSSNMPCHLAWNFGRRLTRMPIPAMSYGGIL